MKTLETTLPLNGEACDRIAKEITAFCAQNGVERKKALRYRLSAEECLLQWLSNGFEGETVTLQMGRRFTPYIRLEISGAAFNPYQPTAEYGAFSSGILTSLNLSPSYSYAAGKNRIQFTLERKKLSQLSTLLLVIVFAVFVGLMGNLLPDTLRDTLLNGLLNPVYDTFFRVLSCFAGPMIFLSVAWGVYGIGDAATLGRIGKRMMLTFATVTLAAAAMATVFYPFLGPPLGEALGRSGELSSVIEIILGIFPGTIIEPFATGNTLQIIFLSFVIGIALLYLGERTGGVARAIEQINTLVQFLMNVITRIVPFMVFLVIVSFIWSRDYKVLSSVWSFFLVLIVTLLLLTLIAFLFTAWRTKVSPLLLLKKTLPTFAIATATASTAAAFGSNVSTCKDGFGIDPSLSSFGIPLGMVMHRPVLAPYYVLLSFYLARTYGISCSLSWIGLAVFLSAILAIATPPIPGGSAIAYTLLLSQLGLPDSALPFLLTVDIVTDFLMTGFEVALLPPTLIRVAYRLGMINTDVLRADKQSCISHRAVRPDIKES